MSGAGATLFVMAIKVRMTSDEPSLIFGDRDRLEVAAGGVLKISKADGKTLYINPTRWATAEETPGPAAMPVVGDPEPAPEDHAF